jgi:hypothetical protein
MNDQNLQPKKTWQERQKERELEAKRARRKRTVKRIGYLALALAAVFALGWRYVATSAPKGPDLSEPILILGRNHIPDGTKFDGYNSNPPTSGPHYPQPANTGFYSAELPDERVVHNLEHGHVWIAYRPNLPEEVIGVLRKFAGGMVIVAPRAANDKDIALAAWGRLDKFDFDGGPADKQRIRDFILRYQNQGPEKVTVSSHIR